MCVSMTGPDDARVFDPHRCPLLQGLSNEEADRMMESDPRIRACIAAMTSDAPSPEPCVAKMVQAYDRQAPKVA